MNKPLVRKINRQPASLPPGIKFEHQVKAALEGLDYEVRRDVLVSGTQVDLLAERPLTLGRASEILLVECKDGKENVGVKEVMILAAKVESISSKKQPIRGLIISAAGFTNKAKSFAAETGIILFSWAELLRLAFDPNLVAHTHLAHYEPCFNSVLNDSMTFMYRVMGARMRQIGLRAAAGEAIHQSALDRRASPACSYGPMNLASALASNELPLVNTGRIQRGIPCAPLK